MGCLSLIVVVFWKVPRPSGKACVKRYLLLEIERSAQMNLLGIALQLLDREMVSQYIFVVRGCKNRLFLKTGNNS